MRGPAWRFLDLGRRIERALLLLGLVEASLVPAVPPAATQALYETVLTATESLVEYRRRYRSDLTLDAIVDLLLVDDANPRSLAFQLDRLVEDLAGLPAPGRAAGHAALVETSARALLGVPDRRLSPARARRARAVAGAGRRHRVPLVRRRDEPGAASAGARVERPGGHPLPGHAPHRLPVRRARGQRPDDRPPPRAGDAPPARAARRGGGGAGAGSRHTHIDGFGNLVSYLALQWPHERAERDGDERGGGRGAWRRRRHRRRGHEGPALLANDTTPDGLLARQCAMDSALVVADGALAAYAEPSFPAGRAAARWRRRPRPPHLHRVRVRPGLHRRHTPPPQVLGDRRGVCQDFAHLAIGCLRSLGLPARYVSGYIETEPPPGETKLVGSDASHAWFSVFVPGYGWLDADPTNDQVPPHRHITVAWGRDYGDVTPVRVSCSGRRSSRRWRSPSTSCACRPDHCCAY